MRSGFFWLALVFFYLYRHITFKNRANRYALKEFYKRGINYSYIINSDGFEENCDSKISTYKWSYFIEAIITDDLILLYESKIKFRIFSQESYSISDFKLIKEWIRDKVKIIGEE